MKLKLFREMLLLSIFLDHKVRQNHYELRVNRESNKGTFFGTAHQVLACPLTLRPQMLHIYAFPD